MLDNLKVNNFERSLFIIKPDSYQYKNEILKDLTGNGFELQNVRDVVLNREFLSKIYNEEEDALVNKMNIEYLAGKMATIGVVMAEKGKERLFKICGESYIPDMCEPNSIRYKYSTIRTPITVLRK